MKIVFFGTPEIVIPIVKNLYKYYEIVAVVTQAPKPTGRKQILTYSPVDKWAHSHKLPIFYTPESLIKANIEADLGILAAYGKIVSEECLQYFPNGILNIHPSLLPQLRGASPLQSAIAQGLVQTGATIIKLDDKMDHGPIVGSFTEDIEPTDTPESLGGRIFARGAQVLIELIPSYLAGKINLKTQDHALATFTKLLNKDSGFVALSDLKLATEGEKAIELEQLFRAMQPWPGVWTLVNEKRLKITQVHLENDKFAIDEVQLESKNPVPWKQFNLAYHPFLSV